MKRAPENPKKLKNFLSVIANKLLLFLISRFIGSFMYYSFLFRSNGGGEPRRVSRRSVPPPCWPSDPFLCELCVIVLVDHLQNGAWWRNWDSATETLDHVLGDRHEQDVLAARISRVVASVGLRDLVIPQREELRREKVQRFSNTNRTLTAL